VTEERGGGGGGLGRRRKVFLRTELGGSNEIGNLASRHSGVRFRDAVAPAVPEQGDSVALPDHATDRGNVVSAGMDEARPHARLGQRELNEARVERHRVWEAGANPGQQPNLATAPLATFLQFYPRCPEHRGAGAE